MGEQSGTVDRIDGHRRETWHDAGGRAVVTRYDIDGIGHGTPIDTRGAEACGTAGPHMLEANICSTRRIAESWDLTGKIAATAKPKTAIPLEPVTRTPTMQPPHHIGVGAVIENALRAAGLMR